MVPSTWRSVAGAAVLLLLPGLRAAAAADGGASPPGSPPTEQEQLDAQLRALKDDPPALWAWVNEYVVRLEQQGHYAQALEAARLNVELARKIFPRTDERAVRSLANCGQILITLGHHEEGEPYLWEALARTLEVKRLDRNAALIFSNLGDLYAWKGKYDEASTYYEKAMQVAAAIGRLTDPDMALILNHLGETQMLQGKLDESEKNFHRAMSVLVVAKVAPEDPAMALTVSNLASVYLSRGELEQAEHYYGKIVEVLRSAHGVRHPDVAATIRKLGRVYADRRRFAEAELLMQRALAIVESLFGKGHVQTAPYLHELGAAYLAWQKYDKAEPVLTQAMAAIDSAMPDSPDASYIANDLAAVLMGESKLAEAELYAARSLAIAEKTLPAEHAGTVNALSALSTILYRQEKYTAAEPLAKRLIAILEKNPAGNRDLLALTYENYAALLRALGRDKEAEEYRRKADVLMPDPRFPKS